MEFQRRHSLMPKMSSCGNFEDFWIIWMPLWSFDWPLMMMKWPLGRFLKHCHVFLAWLRLNKFEVWILFGTWDRKTLGPWSTVFFHQLAKFTNENLSADVYSAQLVRWSITIALMKSWSCRWISWILCFLKAWPSESGLRGDQHPQELEWLYTVNREMQRCVGGHIIFHFETS